MKNVETTIRSEKQPMAAATNIGAVIKRLRERWRLTQQDVVSYARLERSASYLSSIETGKTSPTLAELEAIAIVLRTNALDLLREAQGVASEAAPQPEDATGRLVALFQTLPPAQQELALDLVQCLSEREQRKGGSTKG